jgi:hypothetical protein
VAVPVAVPLLSSCTRKPKPIAGPTGSASAGTPTGSASASGAPKALKDIVNANTGRIDVAIAQPETLVNEGRLAIGLVKDNARITDANVMVYIGQDANLPPVASGRASWVQGEVAPLALYVADLSFPSAGEWLVGISARLKDGTVYGGGASLTVAAASTAPVAGQPAPSVVTPTVAAPGVADPLCSDLPTACPMHEISLDAALKNGKPTVVTIAAPAYCKSETCGPVVHLVTTARTAYADRYNFIHIEAYDKDSVGTLVPAADAWHINSEPYTFFVDAQGIVKDRLAGAFGADELAKRLAALQA